jgi:ferritin-like metal-binding protein YciE
MSESETLHDLFVEELCDSYDSEKQLVKALKKMVSAAKDPALKAAFDGHLQETMGHVTVLEEVFGLFDMKPKGKHSNGIAGVIKEASSDADEESKSSLRDCALIGGGRRAEHYEMGAYMSLIAMGEELDYVDACALLRGILAEEEAADKKLAELAQSVNAAAHKHSMAKV